jgi:hypothetical protein
MALTFSEKLRILFLEALRRAGASCPPYLVSFHEIKLVSGVFLFRVFRPCFDTGLTQYAYW